MQVKILANVDVKGIKTQPSSRNTEYRRPAKGTCEAGIRVCVCQEQHRASVVSKVFAR